MFFFRKFWDFLKFRKFSKTFRTPYARTAFKFLIIQIFADSTALFLRFFVFFSTFVRFRCEMALLRPVQFRFLSEKSWNPLYYGQSASEIALLRPMRFFKRNRKKKTEMALLRPIRHSASAGPFRKQIGRSIGYFSRFFERN